MEVVASDIRSYRVPYHQSLVCAAAAALTSFATGVPVAHALVRHVEPDYIEALATIPAGANFTQSTLSVEQTSGDQFLERVRAGTFRSDDPMLLELSRRVVEEMERTRPFDVSEWAARIARDVGGARD